MVLNQKKPFQQAADDDFVPEFTRTSDTKKKFSQKKSTQSSFGPKKLPADAGVITRTSDRKSLYKRAAPGAAREKPAASSKSYAVWLLSRRDYSAGILRNKLVLRGYSQEEADEALTFVTANGYQNDTRYAQSLATALSRRSGNNRVLMTMKQKQIDPATSTLQLETLAPESERVIDVASKFKKDIAVGGLTQKLQQKIYRFLAYRGFSGNSIKIAMRSLAADAKAQGGNMEEAQPVEDDTP